MSFAGHKIKGSDVLPRRGSYRAKEVKNNGELSLICRHQVRRQTDFLVSSGFRNIIETRPHFQLTIMANRYPNDPFNQYSPYQPGSPLNFPGSGSREFLQFPGFYYSSSHGMQQGAEQFNPTVQTPSPSLPTEPLKPGPSTQKSRERWQTRDEAVLVQLWADNIDRLESKDSRKAWDEIVKALNDKQGITKTVDQCQRKLKHIKNLYKEKKDWNRKQSGENIRKSPNYDAIDAFQAAGM